MADRKGSLKKAGHAVSTTVPRRKKLLEGVDLEGRPAPIGQEALLTDETQGPADGGEAVHVAALLPRRRAALPAHLQGPVPVAPEDVRVLGDRRGGQDHIGELRCLGHEELVHHEEQVLPREPFAHSEGVGQGGGGVVAPDKGRAEPAARQDPPQPDLAHRRRRRLGADLRASDDRVVQAEVIPGLEEEPVRPTHGRGEARHRAHVLPTVPAAREADPRLDQRRTRREQR